MTRAMEPMLPFCLYNANDVEIVASTGVWTTDVDVGNGLFNNVAIAM